MCWLGSRLAKSGLGHGLGVCKSCTRQGHAFYSLRFLGVPAGEAATVRAEGGSSAAEHTVVPCIQGKVAPSLGQQDWEDHLVKQINSSTWGQRVEVCNHKLLWAEVNGKGLLAI